MPKPPHMQQDPILATIRDVRGMKVLPPCVLYARLGRGGMGAVYLGKHLTLLVKQVVKCLWLWGQNQDPTEEFIERFHQEARIAADMSHQNLVRVSHVDRMGEIHYLVMEYVHGEDARKRVQRRGPLSEEQALTLLLGAASGLGFAHVRNIVHRDIKPANLMISTRGEVKVIDLGLARALHVSHQLTGTHGTMGTPQFMAPEQWDTAKVGPPADVWALGATLYYLLTGASHVPGELEDQSAIRRFICEQPFPAVERTCPGVSPETRQILARCVARDPAERYPDASVLAADLARLVRGDERILADPHGATPIQGREPTDEEVRALRRLIESGADETRDEPPQEATLAAGLERLMRSTHTPPGTVPTRTLAGAGDQTMTATPVVPTRRRWWLWLGALAVLGLAAVAVAYMLQPSPEQLELEARAAVNRGSYEEAVAKATRLEGFRGYADLARSILIQALLEHSDQLKASQPTVAFTRLAQASEAARRLSSPRDQVDKENQIKAARTPLEDDIRGRIQSAVRVVEPAAGVVVTRTQVPVVVQIQDQGLAITASLDGKPLAAGTLPGQWQGQWAAPPDDGDRQLEIVFTETRTSLEYRRPVAIQVKLAQPGLDLAVPTAELTNRDEIQLTGRVLNQRARVSLEVTPPAGQPEAKDLGEREGEFTFAVVFPKGRDGAWRIRLATGADPGILSPERQVRVDRGAPELDPLVGPDTPIRDRSWVLRGIASEPCSVFVRGRESTPVQTFTTDKLHRFEITLELPERDGSAPFVIEAKDPAGNQGKGEPVEVQVDRTPPRVEETPRDLAVKAAELEVAGRLSEAGVVWGEGVADTRTGADGQFTFKLPVLSGEGIDQPWTWSLRARDRAGNPAQPAVLTVRIDRKGPDIVPDLADGTFWSGRKLVLKVLDSSGPCEVQAGSARQQTPAGVRVELDPGVTAEAPVRVTATDRLENRSVKDIPPPRTTPGPGPIIGPNWGEPVARAKVDPYFPLYERVAVKIGEKLLILRLVRPLNEKELPGNLDEKARLLLKGGAPVYLSETEVPVEVWDEYLKLLAAAGAPAAGPRRVFNPRTCRTEPLADAAWSQPLHPNLRKGTDPLWPVTQVTPEEAKAFCGKFGLRLPLESEWLFVTRMASTNTYGWGPPGQRGAGTEQKLEDRANVADRLLKDLCGTLGGELSSFERHTDGFALLAPVDALPRGGERHPWGFKHLLGNVAEWCETDAGGVVARGGSWQTTRVELRVDVLPRNPITTGSWDSVGFRVARPARDP